ncbi:MAG: glycosyltransferase [Phycisphaerales bacterium JB059]
MTHALTIIAAQLLLDMLGWHRLLGRGIRRTPPPSVEPATWPSVSVVRPIKGADTGQAENLAAALGHEYPGEVETIFVFDDEEDPGYAPTHRAVQEHQASGRPGRARVITCGAPPPHRTGKLHAMIVGAEHATGDLLAFGDSDTRPDPGLLRRLVATLLADERTACTFSPAVVVGRLRTAGDVGYAMMLNALYGSVAAWRAGRTGELPFIMGQIMVFRREALDEVGGVACAEGELVDDMAIGRCLHEAGWKNVMVTAPLSIVAEGISLGQFLRIYRRWLLFGKNGLSISFTWPVWVRSVEYFLALIVAIISAAMGAWVAMGLALLGVLAFGVSNIRLHRLLGGGSLPITGLWMVWALLLIAPFVQISMRFGGVDWRGRDYRLGKNAALAED